MGDLVGHAWTRAASVGNAISGFMVCEICPLNFHIIPDNVFATSD